MDPEILVAASYPFITVAALWAQHRAMADEDASASKYDDVSNIEAIFRYAICFVPFINFVAFALYIEKVIPWNNGFVQWLTKKRKDNK